MPIKLKNNASGTLATAISASDTGIVLTTGNGAAFPTLSTADYFYATLVSTGGTQEVVKVTARVGDTMTVVRAQEGSSAAGFATGSRLELRITAGSIAGYVQDRIVSVLDFGAVGDGVTDDTTAIQAALDAGGGARWAIYFPTGVYLISAALTGLRNTVIYGDGWSSKVRVANAINPTHIIKFGDENDVTSVEIHDIEFDGNKIGNPTGGDGIVVVRGFKANLFNVRVIDCAGDGVQYQAVGSCFENYIRGLSSYRNDGYGFRFVGAVTDTHIFDSDIGANELGGVLLGTSSSVNGSTIWGGGASNANGIETAGVSSQIVGNRIEGHGKNGIVVGSGNNYMYIADNKIYANSFTAGNSGLYDGIVIGANASFGTIVNNKIYSAVSSASPYSMRYAVNFLGAHEQWTIVGNDFPLLTAGNPASFSSSVVVNGVLSTDKTDHNWIRTRVIATRSADFNAAAAFTWIAFPYNVESVDQLNEFTSGTFVPKNSGLYRIEAQIVFLAAAANESIGLALYTTAGAAIRRLGFVRSGGTSSEMVGGVITEFLTAGVSYDVRYLAGSTATQFIAGSDFTYVKIQAIAN